MLDDLKPYPEYRKNAETWLGAVPTHWKFLPNRAVFEEIKDQGHSTEPMLSVTISRGVIQQADLLSDTSKKDSSNLDRSKYKLVQPGDIAYNKMRAWQGAVGASKHRGIISPAYVVQRLRAEDNPEYFHHLFRSPGFAKEAERWSYGITSDMWSLRPEHFKTIYTCVPPSAEQAGIVRFLGAVDRKVNRFIRAKRRLIEVLTEQKQRLTQTAIASSSTKLHRMRDLVADPKREVGRVEHQEYTPIGLYNWGRGIFQKVPTRGQDLGDSVFFWLEEGDLVFSGQFAWEGAVSLVRRKDHRCIASHRYPVFISKTTSVRTSYLEAFFQSSDGQLLMDVNSRGAAGRNRPLNARSLLREMVPVPSLDEQLAIEDFGNHLQKTFDVIGRQIALVREYRTRLVADVVTGKVDVRSHPWAGEEAAPADDADALAPDADAAEAEGDEDAPADALEAAATGDGEEEG